MAPTAVLQNGIKMFEIPQWLTYHRARQQETLVARQNRTVVVWNS